MTINANLMLLMGRIIAGVSVFGVTSTYVVNHLNQQGVVTGILYIGEELSAEMEAQGMEGSSIIVDGKILRQGATIDGVQVVAIERLCAEFEKNGIRWKQRVRQKPDPAWKDPD